MYSISSNQSAGICLDKVHKSKICGFLLIPQFPMIALSAAIEPLRLANRELGFPAYDWRLVTIDGCPGIASNGISLNADCRAADIGDIDLLVVCGGAQIEECWSKELMFLLMGMDRMGIQLGAVCSGSYLLAKAGLLDNYSATIHWENMAIVRENFPRVNFTNDLFEIDSNRLTCAGGTASIDMVLAIIRKDHGDDINCRITESLICERARDQNDRQRIPLRAQLGTSQPKLSEAVALMEANIEEPISLDDISRYIRLSKRQLERLFKKYLGIVPNRYYLEIRLIRSRQLILQTNGAIIDVALACGFGSTAYFSKCYKNYFGVPPGEDRRLHFDSKESQVKRIKALAP